MDRSETQHVPVLCDAVMEFLRPSAGETAVDVTVGHGGHSRLLLEAVGPTGRLIGLDVDPANLERTQRNLAADEGNSAHVDLVRSNFSELGQVLDELGVGKVDVILADLGVSTDQLLSTELGLTFTEDGPLDMRLDDRLPTTAADLVNGLPEQELADLIYEHSQERFSRRIAKWICQARRDERLKRTSELVRIVCSALGQREDSRRSRIHPATRTFQALRVAVNHERENLETFLESAAGRLAIGGRIGVISFHSGEDRIVKRDFLARQRIQAYEILTKKPINPTADEIRRNSRSRSAKFRAALRKSDVRDAA